MNEHFYYEQSAVFFIELFEYIENYNSWFAVRVTLAILFNMCDCERPTTLMQSLIMMIS